MLDSIHTAARAARTALLAALLATGLVAGAQTTLGKPEPAYHWLCAGGTAALNHHPAAISQAGAVAVDSVPYSEDYTIVTVSRPGGGTEATLWSLDYGGATRALTTERIVSDSTTVRYAAATTSEPQINTLRQTAPDSANGHALLVIGGAGGAQFAEVRYYPYRLGGAELRVIQSALALRYGVTLGPVDYVDGEGRRVWSHGDGEYHHRIAGVGMDTVTGLSQRESRSEMEGGMLSIAADSVTHGMFLVAGDNGGPLSMVSGGDGDTLLLSRVWRAQCAGTEGRRFTLTFLTGAIEPHLDSLILVLSDGRVFHPDSASGDRVVYTGVTFSPGEHLFTLAHGGMNRRAAMATAFGEEGGAYALDGRGDSPVAARLYPNPTSGRYTIEVAGAKRVRVTVYTVRGVPVASYISEDCGRCRFEGELPAGSVHYATVETETGSQTMKIVAR